jgi:hypothetical protein
LIRLASPILRDRWKPGPHHGDEGPFFVSLTIFTYRSYRDLPGIVWAGSRLSRGWQTRAGAVGLIQWGEPARRLTGAVSVWKSHDDLRRFIQTPEHLVIMRKWRARRMYGTSQSWEIDRVIVPELWRQARERLIASRPPRCA